MNRKYLVLLLAVVVAVALATPVFAGKGGKKGGGAATPLNATFQDLKADELTGVTGDGNPYMHNDGAVQCYFGVAGKDVDLVTYNTGRKLHFKFADSDVAGTPLPAEFDAEVDFFGINYWGQYMAMTVGRTAQVQMDLEFYMGNITYELDYSSLAVKRTGENTWLVTSDINNIGGFPGFYPSDEADLNVIRRRKQQTYATVNMPIRFTVTLQ